MAGQPVADVLPAAGSTASLRIVGVAHGRFTLEDGRRADKEWQAAEMVANFRPASVPILSRHGGMWLGDIDSLAAEGADLRFSGTVRYDTWLHGRLRRGVPVSIETGEGRPPRLDGRPHADAAGTPWSVSHPYYRGVFGVGMNLLGVALLLNGEQPAAPWSAAWIVD